MENLEQTTQMYYGCTNRQEDIDSYEKQGLKSEGATVRESFFGRWPTKGLGKPPIGLNVTVDFNSYGTAGLTYVKMDDITGLMQDLDVNNPEEMVGKKVVGYFPTNSMRLIALSVEKGDEE